jgi:hypothetical protein
VLVYTAAGYGAGQGELGYTRTHLERDGGDGVAPGVGGLGGRRGRVQHARQRLPLVQAERVAHEQDLLPLPPPQKVLPVEPAALANNGDGNVSQSRRAVSEQSIHGGS